MFLVVASLLLVHPLFLSQSETESDVSSPYFPLGLLYLAAYVRERQHDVAIFDGTFSIGVDAFRRRLADESPDVVGISALAATRDAALDLAKEANETGAIVIMGGPDPTADPACYLANPAVDVVVHHEGEETIVELLSLFDEGTLTTEMLTSVEGVAFRREGRAVVNQPRPPIENLDGLPEPARDLINMSKYLDHWEETHGYSSVPIATARGCPQGCDWCKNSVHGQQFRQRSPESVAAEVASLKATYRIARLRVVDDVDEIDRDWFERWAELLEHDDAAIPFEALNELQRKDLPLLDVQDSL